MPNNPNPQPDPKKQPDRKHPRAEDPELEPIDFRDEIPPVIKANAEGEGDEAVNQNEGEGSRTADEQYRAGVKKTLNTRNIEKDAKKAKEALEDEPQRKDLEDAEEAGRKGQLH